MKKLLWTVLPVMAGLAIFPATLSAQVSTVQSGGKLTLNLNEKFRDLLNANNAGAEYIGASPTDDGEHFTVSGGTVRLGNGLGSVTSFGASTFTEGDNTLSLDQFEFEAFRFEDVVTAEVFLNGTDQGRLTVFVLSDDLFQAPLSYGKYTSGRVQFTFDPDFQADFSRYIPLAGLKPNEILGTFKLAVTLGKSN